MRNYSMHSKLDERSRTDLFLIGAHKLKYPRQRKQFIIKLSMMASCTRVVTSTSTRLQISNTFVVGQLARVRAAVRLI